jgi:CRP-like cAMP-binding protein
MNSKQQPKGRRMTREELFTIDGRTLGAMTKAEERFARFALSLSRRIGSEQTEGLTAEMGEMYETGGTRRDVESLLAGVAASLPALN